MSICATLKSSKGIRYSELITNRFRRLNLKYLQAHQTSLFLNSTNPTLKLCGRGLQTTEFL